MKSKLVPEASQWHRLWSIRWAIATAVLAAVGAAWITLPADWTDAVPGWVKAALALGTVGTAAAGAISRVIKQEGLRDPD